MVDPITFLGTVCLQLGVDVVRQIAFALPVAYAWEFEKNVLWWQHGEQPGFEAGLLITGLAAGSISVLTWPQENLLGYPLAVLVLMATPLLTGLFMRKTGEMFRELGTQPPSMFAVRDAAIFGLGVSLMRAVSITGG